MRTSQEYQGLVTSWLSSKPNFYAFVGAMTAFQGAAQTLLASMPEAYDLNAASGAQLDVLGQWIGLSRNVETPLPNVYFSFDTPGLGWDEGVWQGPFNPTEGVIQLDDTTYLTLLLVQIAVNTWDGTTGTMYAALSQVLSNYPGAYLFIQNGLDGTMTVGISGTLPPPIVLALFAGGYFDFQPAGVNQQVLVTSSNGAPIFGFDVNNEYIGGWDIGAWGVSPTT